MGIMIVFAITGLLDESKWHAMRSQGIKWHYVTFHNIIQWPRSIQYSLYTYIHNSSARYRLHIRAIRVTYLLDDLYLHDDIVCGKNQQAIRTFKMACSKWHAMASYRMLWQVVEYYSAKYESRIIMHYSINKFRPNVRQVNIASPAVPSNIQKIMIWYDAQCVWVGSTSYALERI